MDMCTYWQDRAHVRRGIRKRAKSSQIDELFSVFTRESNRLFDFLDQAWKVCTLFLYLFILIYFIKKKNFKINLSIKDLIDDLFGYSKDRFFIGEILQITGQKNQTCKIIDVLIPQSALMEQQQQQASSSFDEPIDVEMDQSNHSNGKKSQTNGLLIGINIYIYIRYK